MLFFHVGVMETDACVGTIETALSVAKELHTREFVKVSYFGLTNEIMYILGHSGRFQVKV